MEFPPQAPPAPGVPQTEERGSLFGVEADVASGYAWNGILQVGRPVALPSAWATVSGVTLTAGAVRPLDRAVRGGADASSDLELAVDRTLGPLEIAPAIDFSSGRDLEDPSERPTTDVSLRVQRGLGAAAIFTSQDVDVRAHRGAYLGTVGIGREEARGNARAVIWSACVGWASPAFNEAYHGARVAALDFVAAGLGLTCPLGARGYVRPHVDFSDVLSPRLRPLLRHPSVLAAGLATGIDFFASDRSPPVPSRSRRTPFGTTRALQGGISSTRHVPFLRSPNAPSLLGFAVAEVRGDPLGTGLEYLPRGQHPPGAPRRATDTATFAAAGKEGRS